MCELKKKCLEEKNNGKPHMQQKGRQNRTCTKQQKQYRIKDNTPNKWVEIVKVYKQSKKLRKFKK